MKTSSIPQRGVLGAAALAVVCLLTLPQALQAKGKGPKDQQGKSHRNDRAWQTYSSHPRSSFTLTFGTGYAGRGYYYGPPNSAYYYERPDVMYYPTRAAAPREYYSRASYSARSTEVAVQSALARSGYYRGSIDGQIGPQSRRAIARYQQAQGLRVTGAINTSLLRSLGL
jgi:hypothetical protein